MDSHYLNEVLCDEATPQLHFVTTLGSALKVYKYSFTLTDWSKQMLIKQGLIDQVIRTIWPNCRDFGL